MKLKSWVIWRSFFTTTFRVIGLLFSLCFPVLVLGMASVWIDMVAQNLPKDLATFLMSNKESITSIFNVLAGAYLTLFATYYFNSRTERKKVIASKELDRVDNNQTRIPSQMTKQRM